MSRLIRKGQTAELLGVSAPRVSQLLRAGHLREVPGTGMLSKTEVEQFAQSRDDLGSHHQLHPRARMPAGHRDGERPQRAPAPVDRFCLAIEDSLPPIAVSRQRLEALRAEIAQHDLDARQQKLVSRADVARSAFEEGMRIRQALEGWPMRSASSWSPLPATQERQRTHQPPPNNQTPAGSGVRVGDSAWVFRLPRSVAFVDRLDARVKDWPSLDSEVPSRNHKRDI